MYTSKKDGARFLREDWPVLRREREPASGWVVIDVVSACHRAKPLPNIAFVEAGTGCQFLTGGRTTCKFPEKTEPITYARHHSRCQATGICEDLAEECFDLCLIDGLLSCHVFFSFSHTLDAK